MRRLQVKGFMDVIRNRGVFARHLQLKKACEALSSAWRALWPRGLAVSNMEHGAHAEGAGERGSGAGPCNALAARAALKRPYDKGRRNDTDVESRERGKERLACHDFAVLKPFLSAVSLAMVSKDRFLVRNN